MDNRLIGLILAGGDEAAFKSKTPKVLHSLLGTSLLRLTAEALGEVGPARLIVAGLPRDLVAAEVAGLTVTIVEKTKDKGPAAAVHSARKEWARDLDGDVLIVPADLPLVESAVLRALVSRHRKKGNAGTMLWADAVASGGSEKRIPVREIEDESDFPADHPSRRIPTGIFVFRARELARVLLRVIKPGHKGASDLTAAFGLLAAAGRPVGVFLAPDPEDVQRIVSRFDLGRAADRMRLRKIRALAEGGVTILSPASTWIDWNVKIGPETVVYPGTVIEGPTVIGRNGRIYPNAHIVRSVIGDDVHVLGSTVIEDATVENDVRIGPFARVRMQTTLRSGSRVGNFVEMKKTDFGPRSKAMHLSYLGDSEVGEAANIGAGTITCNYDGVNKNRTIIGSGAFIGSGSELVAPVRIGRGAYIAAGSVITKDVEDDALAVARGRQVDKPGWAAARRAKLQKEKSGGSKP
ncbi:MAG: bifunctional UDP-N-acetylglucosamine diphosphorylase/glucosamine-1-phosphate N-acetyltransferase GlmU [Candidatus Aminicenantes bacterium]|nr:bifunctional UDP-N-acetylglucosamine diphosphorylase/glucosamine-1-phosphate N-acetyltransferase GlmU [Candidatus Aminicenantes bacterium]